MENPTPFDLNEAIRRWQQNLGTSPAFKADNLEELASHLRASVQKLKSNGLSEEEAFLTAADSLGEPGPLEKEYAKVNPPAARSWVMHLFWVVAGVYFLQDGYLLVCAILNLRLKLEQISLRRLILGGTDPRQVASQIGLFHRLPPFFTIELSIVTAAVLILCGLLAIGRWRGFGIFIRSFAHSARTALALMLPGLVLTYLPEFWGSFPTRLWTSAPVIISVWADGRSTNRDMARAEFALHKFEKITEVPVDYLAGLAVANTGLVFTMVLLAHWRLRKLTSVGFLPHNRATSSSR